MTDEIQFDGLAPDESTSGMEGGKDPLQIQARNNELQAARDNYVKVLGFVAHELKNPLASAMLSLYTVKDGYLGDVTPAQAKSLASAARSLDDMQEMIGNYLDLCRLEQGEVQVTRTFFPLHPRVIQPVLDGLEGALQGRRMVVEDQIPQDRVVCADAALIRIVYGNLLSNAIKYGREGGTIRLGAEEQDGELILSVSNDGAGIPPEQIPRLFQRFSRLHDPDHTGQRGTGLGLYICREIVDKHGGKIWVDCRAGAWVTFSFTLPQPAAEAS